MLATRLRRSGTELHFLRLLQKGLLPFLKSSLFVVVVVFLVFVSAPLFRPSFFARDRKYYVALNKWVIRGNICLCTSATVLKASETQVKYLREQATALPLARDSSFCPPPLLLAAIPLSYSIRLSPLNPVNVYFYEGLRILSVILSKLFARETSGY